MNANLAEQEPEPDMDSRIVRAEAKLESIETNIAEIKADLRSLGAEMRAGFDDVRKEMRAVFDELRKGNTAGQVSLESVRGAVETVRTAVESAKVLALVVFGGALATVAIGLLGIIARGFKWI
jgi:chromosome segregation ATPase